MQIARTVATIMEGHRAEYLWTTKPAAAALGIDPSRFGDWWYRTDRKLRILLREQPEATAAMLLMLLASAIPDP